jgi:hypothetical protein
MIYRANPTDEDGYPLIPDNIKYVKACVTYIALKMLTKSQIQGKSINPNVAQRIEQDSLFYMGAADTAGRMPTIDDMESWKNNFIRLIPNINAHRNAFREDGRMERRFNSSNINRDNINPTR